MRSDLKKSWMKTLGEKKDDAHDLLQTDACAHHEHIKNIFFINHCCISAHHFLCPPISGLASRAFQDSMAFIFNGLRSIKRELSGVGPVSTNYGKAFGSILSY